MGSARSRRIAFRFDFGGATGWGHLARCAALAAEMQARRWSCLAWTAGDLSAAPADLRAVFGEVLPATSHPPTCDWLVVDHYGYSDDALAELRPAVPEVRLLAIDDDATRSLRAADIVLNSRLGLVRAPYEGARLLLGERYALLRPGLRRPVAIPASFEPNQKPVLVLLGGTDPRGLTATAVEALHDIGVRDIVPVVLRQRDLPGGDAVARALQRFPASHWIDRLDASALAGWARACRAAISACGGALYELAHVRLPFVGIIVADNQRALANEAAARWGMPILEGSSLDLRRAIAVGVNSLLDDGVERRASLGEIDGLGARRVADAIEAVSG